MIRDPYYKELKGPKAPRAPKVRDPRSKLEISLTNDQVKRIVVDRRYVAVRETEDRMVLSNGNHIKSFSRSEVEETTDSTAMPLTMALYDNLAPPAPPSMIKPIAAYVVNSFSVQYSQQITDSIRSHEKIIIDDSMWRAATGAGPSDGWKYLSMTAPMRLPVSVRLGAILLEPIKGLLGEQNAGDVRYDGMNEAGTSIQTAVARRTTEIIEVPATARAEPTRLDMRRYEGKMTTLSRISMPRTEERVSVKTPYGRTATAYSVPSGVRESGLLQAIVAQCEEALIARRPGATFSFIDIRFGYPQPQQYGVVRYVAVKNFGAKIVDGALREMAAADIDHPVERDFFYLPASTF